MQKKIAALRDALDTALTVHKDGIVTQVQITPSHLRILTDCGFLQPIRPGWYYLNYPGHRENEDCWKRCYWSFVSLYITKRWGGDYCLSPEASLHLLTGSDPPKVTRILHRKPGTHPVSLCFGYALQIRGEKNFPDQVEYLRVC